MALIEINGIPIEAPDGSMVLEVADREGILIPRFCYHKKLSIAANCRMCMVEVEKAPKAMPACATPVTDGMKVHTRSPKALNSQRGVMEFLLINHPLDCPICDQGGECDLQEIAMGYGQDISRYAEVKRVVESPDLGALIATDMTRCIHCTRCVRFGQEIAGIMELGAPGRGEHMYIGAYMTHTVDSELSGNVIDLCPVGALTAKPSRYCARPWEMSNHVAISPHDCVGANMCLDIRDGMVMRAVARENEEVNETWIADRDRFSYTALNHEERLLKPLIKQDGVWHESDWDTALIATAEGLKRMAAAHGGDSIGALSSYTATNEEHYLLQKLMRGIGSNNIDHRLRQSDMSAQAGMPAFPYLGQAISDLEELDAVLLIGSNIRKEQPLLGQRLRKAARRGGRLMAINSVDYDFTFPLEHKVIATPNEMVIALGGVVKALLERGGCGTDGIEALLDGCKVDDTHRAIASQLCDSEKSAVLLGSGAASHPRQAELIALATEVARLAGSRFGFIAEGGNSAGAWLAGAVPHRSAGGQAIAASGRDWRAMFAEGMAGYLLLGVEPELDCADSYAAMAAMQSAGFVAVMSGYATDAMRDYADVLLPMALFPETSGSFVNAEGRWQSFTAATVAPGEARPAWKLLRVLGNLLDVSGFEFLSSEEVRDEVQQACAAITPSSDTVWQLPGALPTADDGVARIADCAIYGGDGMVRRSEPLQATADAAATRCAWINGATATRLGVCEAEQVRVSQGELAVTLPLAISERVADECVWVATGLPQTVGLGGVSVAVEVVKV